MVMQWKGELEVDEEDLGIVIHNSMSVTRQCAEAVIELMGKQSSGTDKD